LHLTIAAVPTSQVASNVARYGFTDRCEIGHSRCQRLLRVVSSAQIRRHPSIGRTGGRIAAPARSDPLDISRCGGLDLNAARFWIHRTRLSAF